MKTKIELVTGFLESGKTTFINEYLNTDICKDNKITVVAFEKGNKNIKNNNGEILYLKEVLELEDVIENSMIKKIDKIVIEYNGTESLEKINEIIDSKTFKKNCEFYGNYFVCNSKNIESYIKNLGELIIPFIQTSKLIVLNNTCEIEKEKLEKTIKILNEVNLTAPIVLSKDMNNLKEDLKNSRFFKENKVEKLLRKLKEASKDDRL